ncbi:GNAT superfamily N-acetyltransferase [Spinactinospora alkalitolerans]|uniref:GNAT superfamily N-acetyltransferase n=1 Tax=Spinactinospora alkalitolerans TaxID=687207 RepID=A0A852TXI8_9ACTN|nr:GNAT family N-acetyltransferase [Spinactinospora alkalitolerans]NYE48075.1 GNAT superfamily N-acetyltransferase [Spinactinospora alkalitolerans]
MRDDSASTGLVFPVPYVPTLGPVHPDAVTPGLWGEVVGNSGTGRFLTHDPAARWRGAKDEQVLVKTVVAAPERMMVPTLLGRGNSLLTVHHYGLLDTGRAREEAGKLAADHGAGDARILWLTQEPHPDAGRCRRIQLKTFRGIEPPPDGDQVGPLHAQPADIRATWPAFTQVLGHEGFSALDDRMRTGTLNGPVLIAATGGRIVGAIGPMATLPDPIGRVRLLPQYFGVLPEHRNAGHGRALWRSAMRWGRRAGADYQLLQTELGGASDRLCQAEGLTTLGFVTTITV